MRVVRILLAIARHDYGKPENGTSYEYNSWFNTLRVLGHEVHHFDTFDPEWGGDPDRAGRALEATVAEIAPDLVLMMLIERDVALESIDRIRRTTAIANWFSDDTWRFRAFSSRIAHHFSWVVTTSRLGEAGYRRLGVPAVYSAWGYDEGLYHPVPEVEPTIDVGFVGQRYGRRGDVIQSLIDQGFSVVARGSGWPGGRIDDADLASQYASTRINLNFLESSAGPFQRRGITIRGSWRADRLITHRFAPPTQLKARPFEITACGGFLLTNDAPELREFFDLDREVGIFADERALPERIRYFLQHPDERQAIANAGLQRSKEYSWPTVLSTILEQMC